jgi:cytochrome P450
MHPSSIVDRRSRVTRLVRSDSTLRAWYRRPEAQASRRATDPEGFMSAAPVSEEIDPFLSPEFISDPVSVIRRLRESDPVHLIPGLNAWMVTRWDYVRELFAHPSTTNDRRAFERYELPPEGSVARWAAENGLFAAPPDQHARMRKLVSAALTPRAVARMESQVREVVDQFAVHLKGRRGVVDLMAEYTDPIPNTVIGRITGIPTKGEDERRWRQLGKDSVRGISPLLTPAERKRSEDALAEICDWVREMVTERRNRPQEDLVSDLVGATDESDRMTNDEIVLVVSALVAAGTETTTMGSTRGLRALLAHPDQLERLRRDRTLLPNAVDELLRFDFGAVGLPRYAAEGFEFHGKSIAKGQLLMLNMMGAHRDPEVFPDPDRLDVGRDVKALTIFGHGPHYCLGANLARQELRCIYDSALDFLPEGAFVREDEIAWRRTAIFTGIDTLPVDFG